MTSTQERREQRLRAAIRARGLRVEPYGSAGAVRVSGRGLYILAAGMQHLDELDFEPHQPSAHDAHQNATRNA